MTSASVTAPSRLTSSSVDSACLCELGPEIIYFSRTRTTNPDSTFPPLRSTSFLGALRAALRCTIQ